MMNLADFLTSLTLSNYLAVFQSKGYTDLEQFTSLTDTEIDQVLNSLGMLKGHSFKFKKAIESAKKSEPALVKKPRLDETPGLQATQPLPKTPVKSIPAKPTPPVKQPVAHASTASAPKPTSSLTKDVERLIAKLADIEQVRDDIHKAKDLILAIDLDRYRRSLDQVEFIQKTMRAMEEVNAEMGLEGYEGTQEVEQSGDLMNDAAEYAQEC